MMDTWRMISLACLILRLRLGLQSAEVTEIPRSSNYLIDLSAALIYKYVVNAKR